MGRVNQELGTNGKVSEARKVFDQRTNKSYDSCQAMVTSPQLKGIHEVLYPKGKKEFTYHFLKDLGIEALAVLWMDDGCVVNSKFAKNRGLLATYCSLEEAKIVCSWIHDLTGVKAVPYEDRGLYRVLINASEMPHLATCIRPFVHSSMSSKVTLAFSHYNTKSKREYESSLNIPFVDEGDKAARARSSPMADDIV